MKFLANGTWVWNNNAELVRFGDTIVVTENDPEWPEAYANWLSNKKPPTSSPEWLKGVNLSWADPEEGNSNV